MFGDIPGSGSWFHASWALWRCFPLCKLRCFIQLRGCGGREAGGRGERQSTVREAETLGWGRRLACGLNIGDSKTVN